MQSNGKKIEVKSSVIDLTKTATFGKNKKYDYPFHPDSEEYWFFEVPNDEKLRILLEKFNQNEGYFRSGSIEYLIETIFNSSNGQFLAKNRYAEKRINDAPEIKQQYIINEKLKTFNEIEELQKILGGSIPSDDCFLDLEQSKDVLINYTFGGLGFKSVSEISNYINLLINYRGNLLYLNYLKQLSAPVTPKKIEQEKGKAGRPESPDVAKRNSEIYKELLRLTETRTDAEARPLLLTTFKRYFNKEYETNRRNLDRIIQKMRGR
jgi:hypothetical protein